MKKLLHYVILAIGIIAGYKKTIAEQKAEISRLQALLDAEDVEDAEREAKLAELQGFEAEADAKAADLAALLNDEPAVPTVHPETFDVTEQPTAPPQDLAFRERAAETSGTSEPQGPAGAQGTSGGSGTPGGTSGDAGDAGDKKETAEDLVSTNTKETLLALAEKEGVDVKNSDTKDAIAAAIIAKREEGAGVE